MRRADGLYDITRRDLFTLAGCAGLAALAAGCVDGDTSAIQTGPLGGDHNGTSPDASMGGGTADAAGTATCGTGALDVGAASTFITDKPIYNSTGRFFVVRDTMGLYAVSAKCTHEGAICTL